MSLVPANPALANRKSGDMSTFDVRIWDVSRPLFALLQQASLCFTCPLSESRAAAHVESTYGKLKHKAQGGLLNRSCGVDDCALASLFRLDDMNPIHLVYDSAVDIVNWRTGCRDALNTNPLDAARCGATAIAGSIARLSGSSLMTDDRCVGYWGPLYPRQMASHTRETTAAAFAAYRALHIAHYTIGSTGWPVDTAKKLQPIMPVPGGCFAPGSNPAVLEQFFPASFTGKYGFLFWIPVRCCRPISSAVTCAAEVAKELTVDLGTLFEGVKGVASLGPVAPCPVISSP